jgi:uncharacterized phage protein (TIGR02218 family)
MKILDILFKQQCKGDQTTLAFCWKVELNNGQTITGTDHDSDIIVTAPGRNVDGYYSAKANITGSDIKSGNDMAVDNMEVNGALGDITINDLTVAQIEAGLADKAAVTIFLVNWQTPDLEQVIMRRGFLGEIVRTTDGGYKTEIRGLSQALSQNIGFTYGDRCNVKRFADARCGINIATVQRTAVVTAVTSRRVFTASLTPSTAPPTDTYFSLGNARFTTGLNAGFEREIKRAPFLAGSVVVQMWDEMPDDVQTGDSFIIEPGCDRRLETCDNVHGNILNNRAWGVYIPGMDALSKGPT